MILRENMKKSFKAMLLLLLGVVMVLGCPIEARAASATICHQHTTGCYESQPIHCTEDETVITNFNADFNCSTCGRVATARVVVETYSCKYVDSKRELRRTAFCYTCSNVVMSQENSGAKIHTRMADVCVCTLSESSVVAKVNLTSTTSGWTKGPVTLKASVTEPISGQSLAPYTYSFSGGTASGSSCSVSKNGTYSLTVTGKNGQKATTTIQVNNIDTTAPAISSCYVNKTYPEYESASIIVTASDTSSGLASSAYSFDGGKTYGASCNRTITENGTYVICVRDAVGNVKQQTLAVTCFETKPEPEPETTQPENSTGSEDIEDSEDSTGTEDAKDSEDNTEPEDAKDSEDNTEPEDTKDSEDNTEPEDTKDSEDNTEPEDTKDSEDSTEIEDTKDSENTIAPDDSTGSESSKKEDDAKQPETTEKVETEKEETEKEESEKTEIKIEETKEKEENEKEEDHETKKPVKDESKETNNNETDDETVHNVQNSNGQSLLQQLQNSIQTSIQNTMQESTPSVTKTTTKTKTQILTQNTIRTEQDEKYSGDNLETTEARYAAVKERLALSGKQVAMEKIPGVYSSLMKLNAEKDSIPTILAVNSEKSNVAYSQGMAENENLVKNISEKDENAQSGGSFAQVSRTVVAAGILLCIGMVAFLIVYLVKKP